VNGPPPVPEEDAGFPSLAASAAPKGPANKPAKPKKNKGTKLSLADIMSAPSAPVPGLPKDDRAILMNLPTASRGKVEGEADDGGRDGRLGGAFKDYGGRRE
jgi:hypothetical protein